MIRKSIAGYTLIKSTPTNSSLASLSLCLDKEENPTSIDSSPKRNESKKLVIIYSNTITIPESAAKEISNDTFLTLKKREEVAERMQRALSIPEQRVQKLEKSDEEKEEQPKFIGRLVSQIIKFFKYYVGQELKLIKSVRRRTLF